MLSRAMVQPRLCDGQPRLLVNRLSRAPSERLSALRGRALPGDGLLEQQRRGHSRLAIGVLGLERYAPDSLIVSRGAIGWS